MPRKRARPAAKKKLTALKAKQAAKKRRPSRCLTEPEYGGKPMMMGIATALAAAEMMSRKDRE